ncbi:MAG: Xanthine dehydrogenase [Firmicutes bacterium]|nr:Xanthine dehydrogenase [Bacillota bacterium]
MYDIAKYEEAYTVEEAIALLQANPQAVIISGGSDVLIKLHEGQLPDAQLISIHGIPELKGIKLEAGQTIAIGAGTSFSQISRSDIIQQHLPVLGEAVSMVGGPQIRNIGTIGGNVCNGVTSADSAATLFALNAKLRIQGSNTERLVAIHDFYQGPGKVDLAHGEILTAILITKENYEGYNGHYIKYAMRNAMDIATLGCTAVGKFINNQVTDFRLALGVAGPTPLRCYKTEEIAKGRLVDQTLLAEIGKTAITEVNPRTSWRASKEFRLQLVEELSKRAFLEAYRKAGGEVK